MKIGLYHLLLAGLFIGGCRKEDGNRPLTAPSPFINFTTQNSPLPDNQVNAISVAGTTVWIGTQNGLARLSNGRWQIFNAANSPLPSPVVLSIAAEGGDCVWVGTDKGLVHYCQNKWTEYSTSNSRLQNNVIKEIALDRQREVVWVGTEGGLLRLAGSHQQWFDDTNSGLIDNLITALAITSSGKLLVGTFDPFQFGGSYWQYDGNQWTRLRLNNFGYESSFVNTLFLRNEGAWLGIGGTSGGAVVALQNNQAVIHHNRETSPIISGVLAVAENEKGLWVATGAGLYRLTNSEWKQFTANNSELPDNHLLCMAVGGGKLYIGSIQSGLIEFQP